MDPKASPTSAFTSRIGSHVRGSPADFKTTRTINLPQGNLKDTIHQLAMFLAKGEEKEEDVYIEIASEFLLCYKRFTTTAAFFHRVKKYLPIIRPCYRSLLDSLYRGVRPLGPREREGYFAKDFWRAKIEPVVAGGKARSRFSVLLALLAGVRSKIPELQYELNRVKLVILRKHKEIVSGVHSLSEVAVLKGLSSERDKTIARFFDFSPRAIAEQLTLLEYNIFRQIEPEEFYDKGWTKEKRSPNLYNLVNRADQVSWWVASNILAQKNFQTQMRAVTRFILIGQWCESMGNYNSLMEILGGFHLWCISRLKKTWTMDKKYQILLTHLEHVMSPQNNYAVYRKLLAKRRDQLADGVPTLPYMGLFLKDLTFIEDGNVDVFEDKRLNVEKLTMMGNTLRLIHAFQTVDFSKKIKGKISPLLRHLANVPRMSEEDLNKASELIKPRKALDESSADAISSVSSTENVYTEESGSGEAPTENSNDDDSADVSDMVELTVTEGKNELLATYML